jgi:predicted O-linked N-acetylglucosamine transferase (SPINDLY family)
VPVLTQIGQTFAGRVAASLLNAIGLPELITHSPEEYEVVALELASSREKLLTIREKLNKNRLTTPLFDTALYAAYRGRLRGHVSATSSCIAATPN